MPGNFARVAVKLAALVGVAAASGNASAQAPHPIPPLARPLHERAAEADAIVFARVVRVEPGRLRMETELTLRGAPDRTFEIKRSPLRPPALAPGDRALLFLRGARSPFVLAGEAHEVLRLPPATDAAELATRFPALLSAGDDPVALRSAYESWAESQSPLLRALARDGLAALPEPAAPARGI
jgi:hypothetical protein